MKWHWGMACLFLGLALSGCGGSATAPKPYEIPPPAPAEKPENVAWSFLPNGIRMYIEASQDTNTIKAEPHAVSLCLYQTVTREALVQKASTRAGLLELLQCKATPPQSVLATHAYVQPSAQSIFMLDRAEGAKFLAVVVGFDDMNPQTAFSIVPIPMHIEKERAWYSVFTTLLYSAAPMDAKVFINNQTVQLKGAERVF